MVIAKGDITTRLRLSNENVQSVEWRLSHGFSVNESLIVDADQPLQDVPDIEEVKLSDIISANFYDIFSEEYDKVPYRILKGGRSSLKSSAISIKLVLDFLEDDNANVVCLRKVANTLSTSVYEQIKWAMYMLKVDADFTFLKSPARIIHNATDTAFYFYGVDDPVKIKSHKIARGYVKRLWFEEAAEFDSEQEIDTVTDTFIREDLPEGEEVQVYWSFNPPRNPYVWINEWIEELQSNKDYYISHSDYTQDTLGVLSKQFIRKVEEIARRDPDYHDWMYKGKVIGLGDTIYNANLINVVQEVPGDDKLLFADLAADTGYSTSATAYLFIGYTAKGRSILLDTFYYNPEHLVVKKAPSEFSKALWDFTQKNIKKFGIYIDTWTIDSADGAMRNQFFKDYGISLTPAKKRKKVQMIENVQDLLVQNKVYVLDNDNNKMFVEEAKKYQWDPKTKLTDDPKVVKEDDHTCDAFQYYVMNNLSKLQLIL